MDPSTGTFTTMDTYGGSLTDPMSLHKYLFANSNPVMYSDPSGHMTVGELMLSTTIMSALSATTNAIIAGLEYEKQQNYTPDIFDKGQWECIGLAFLKGLIIGAMSVLAIFVVYALALTVIQCMMAAGICALLAWVLGDDASFNRRNGNDGVAWLEETLSEGFIAAEVTFAIAGVSGGGETYDSRYIPKERSNNTQKIPGRVKSRINIANGRTSTTPLRESGEPVSAGYLEHVIPGHFNRALTESRSVFSITPDDLKVILQSKTVVNSPVTALEGGQYLRVVDTGSIVGNTALKYGGYETSWIAVYTDSAGNLITTYPVPAPSPF